MALHTFPTRAEGKLDIWEVDNADVQFSEWKYCCRCLPEPVWRSAYCVCLENEQKFLIFSNYLESLKYPSPKHIPISILGQNSLQNSHGPMEATISGPGSSAGFYRSSWSGQLELHPIQQCSKPLLLC
ncbi:hypothetical protein AHF37_01723 [Paragonimus kellicotti]|nr:hypothetical protein AHF37_01723 [Paragonimus kellicotti]